MLFNVKNAVRKKKTSTILSENPYLYPFNILYPI